MANEQNLIPQAHKLTVEEQSAGGKISGQKRRERRALKDDLIALLSEGDVQKRLSLALLDEALNGNKAGSVTKAFEVIRDTIGEKPTEKVEVGKLDKTQSMNELQELFADDD